MENKKNSTASDNDYVIREIKESDIPGLIHLMEQLGYPIEAVDMGENVKKYMGTKAQKAWVIETPGGLAGCIAVAITPFFHLKGSFLRVIALVVDKNYRRSGFGKMLMEVAEAYARQQKCVQIELTCGMHRSKLGSHDFYQSLGYSELNATKKYFAKKI